MNAKLFELLVDLEKKIHMESVRSSRDKLDALLCEDFEEIGASGKIVNKAQILDSLPGQSSVKISASDFQLYKLSNSIVRLGYVTTDTLLGDTTRTVLRSSIWKFENGQWKIIFHQGTVTPTKE